jgi:hypothetical protein
MTNISFSKKRKAGLNAAAHPVSPTWVMRSPAFGRGVADVRAGRAPRFDLEDNWEYERGRQWAIVAPRTMPVTIGTRVNPAAISVFLKARIP